MVESVVIFATLLPLWVTSYTSVERKPSASCFTSALYLKLFRTMEMLGSFTISFNIALRSLAPSTKSCSDAFSSAKPSFICDLSSALAFMLSITVIM